MGDILFFMLMAGAGALALGLAFLAFELSLFIIYRLTGGRLDLISYLEKM